MTLLSVLIAVLRWRFFQQLATGWYKGIPQGLKSCMSSVLCETLVVLDSVKEAEGIDGTDGIELTELIRSIDVAT